MSNTENPRLRIMYWYNIAVTGGFALVLAVMQFSPAVRNYFQWPGSDPVLTSLVVPLFVIMAITSAWSLSHPLDGILLLRMQIYYKPFAIALLLYFTATGSIHILWAALLTAGLLLYIIGNIWALRGGNHKILLFV
ncbi:MAG: hypothetical protein ACOC0D_00485 [Spirochaeta sp.]